MWGRAPTAAPSVSGCQGGECGFQGCSGSVTTKVCSHSHHITVPTTPQSPSQAPTHTHLPREDEEGPVPCLPTPCVPQQGTGGFPAKGTHSRAGPGAAQGHPRGARQGLEITRVPAGMPGLPRVLLPWGPGWASPGTLGGCLGPSVPPPPAGSSAEAQSQLCSPRKSALGSTFNPFWAPG